MTSVFLGHSYMIHAHIFDIINTKVIVRNVTDNFVVDNLFLFGVILEQQNVF
jgi:hypothetical protein